MPVASSLTSPPPGLPSAFASPVASLLPHQSICGKNQSDPSLHRQAVEIQTRPRLISPAWWKASTGIWRQKQCPHVRRALRRLGSCALANNLKCVFNELRDVASRRQCDERIQRHFETEKEVAETFFWGADTYERFTPHLQRRSVSAMNTKEKR